MGRVVATTRKGEFAMNKVFMGLLTAGVLATGLMTTGQASAGASSKQMWVYPSGTTSSSLCAVYGSHVACATTYSWLNGPIIVPTSDVPTGNTYADAVAVNCANTGYHSTTWQSFTTVGNGAGDQAIACPVGDTWVSGWGVIFVT
jgi:hypothetical protein